MLLSSVHIDSKSFGLSCMTESIFHGLFSQFISYFSLIFCVVKSHSLSRIKSSLLDNE
ncbi:unnamed protein product [Schistosoma margrebowiei]|uniref:Uncharacterized protein n=1 Tax=Schistosoma margrebowiei TaxID=48269 RepID=A0A183M8I5_9TREM|nr:unnamed protein product [Schistosoma margrebowiei]